MLPFDSDSFLFKTVNGGWSKWKKFGSCSVTCGEGIIPIIRTCDNPKPENDGRFCEGDTNDFGTCSLGACPGKIDFSPRAG